jgi:hypothetical protein
MSWAEGIDPSVKKAQTTRTAQTTTAQDVQTVVAAEEDLLLPGTDDGYIQFLDDNVSEPAPSKGPLGVPIWAWAIGAAGVGYLVLRK